MKLLRSASQLDLASYAVYPGTADEKYDDADETNDGEALIFAPDERDEE